MSAIADDTVGGFAAFVRDQQSVAGRCRLSLAQFDDSYERVYAAVDIQDVPPLDLQPRGSTALHDAMIRLIGEAGAELAALPEDQRPGTVLVAVLTDGHENSSREATGAMVKELVERQQSQWGWQFTYLGANQDAVLTADGLGIRAEDALTYAAGNVDAAFLGPVGQDATAAGSADRRGEHGGRCCRGGLHGGRAGGGRGRNATAAKTACAGRHAKRRPAPFAGKVPAAVGGCRAGRARRRGAGARPCAADGSWT